MIAIVQDLEVKLKTLVEKYTFLVEENEFIRNNMNDLHQKLERQKGEFDMLQKKFETLKIAKTIEGSESYKKETKLKINALVREVDKCILQLSE